MDLGTYKVTWCCVVLFLGWCVQNVCWPHTGTQHRVHLSEPISLLGLLKGIWVKWLKDSFNQSPPKHGWQLTEAGSPEHTAPSAGCSSGWRMSFPGASVGPASSRQFILSFLFPDCLSVVPYPLYMFGREGRGLVRLFSFRGLWKLRSYLLPSLAAFLAGWSISSSYKLLCLTERPS